MTTIVTGFIDLYAFDQTERESHKNINFYFQKGSDLMKSPFNKIVFVEKKFEEDVKPYINDNTTVVFFEREEMSLWPLREKIQSCSLPTNRNHNKDSHDYMIVQGQKIFWIKKAIELNPYKTDNFIWVDFGISYIFKNAKLSDLLCKAVSKTYDRVRISGCWELPVQPIPYNNDMILWFFSGGVFGGDTKSLLEFGRLMEETCLELIEKGMWTWEVNVWYLVYYKNPSLFSWYPGLHEEGMFLNY